MELPVIYVFTHDSIGVGEDGPTHQPIEQLASLRAIPGLVVLRPADANEVVEAWKVVMQFDHQPAAIILTRQDVPTFDRAKYAPASDSGQKRPCTMPRRLVADPMSCSWPLAARSRCAWKRTSDSRRRASSPASSVCPPGSCSMTKTKFTVIGSCPSTSGLGSRSNRRRFLDGRSTSGGMARVSACGPLVPRRRSRTMKREFGFTVERVVEAAKDQIQRAMV